MTAQNIDYTKLLTLIPSFFERQDQAFYDELPTFITLAENRIAAACKQQGFRTVVTGAALPAEVSVLLIEHDMDLVFSFAKRMTVLVNGTVLTEGSPEEIANDPQVKAVYLGHGDDPHDAGHGKNGANGSNGANGAAHA